MCPFRNAEHVGKSGKKAKFPSFRAPEKNAHDKISPKLAKVSETDKVVWRIFTDKVFLEIRSDYVRNCFAKNCGLFFTD